MKLHRIWNASDGHTYWSLSYGRTVEWDPINYPGCTTQRAISLRRTRTI